MPNAHLETILGKRITGVISKRTPDNSREMVFLVFEDDTFMEFYGPTVGNAKGCGRGGYDKALSYLPDCQVLHSFKDE